MQLNKDSWHAKYYKSWHGEESLPQGICVYVCNLIIRSLMLLFIIGFVLKAFYDFGLTGSVIIISTLIVFISLCVLLAKLTENMDKSQTWKLFSEYLKAKRDRWCLTIEWK